MTYTKRMKKTALSYEDLEYNRKLGLPIEIYCPKQHKTIAFGRIEALSNHGVIINQYIYSNHDYIFYGLTKNKILNHS